MRLAEKAAYTSAYPGLLWGILIGRRGETLNALQYLTSLIANRQEGEYRRVIVDTETTEEGRQGYAEAFGKAHG